MSHLERHRSVTCPLAQAGMRLKRYFQEHGNRDGDTAKLSIGVNLDVPGLALPLSLKRSVIVTIRPHHELGDMEPRYSVQWAPELPAPLPIFSGELLVEGGDDYNSFTLRLSGNYTPPLGFVGQAFDVVVGNRVAQETADGLLRTIRDAVELGFQADEARKEPVKPAPDNS